LAVSGRRDGAAGTASSFDRQQTTVAGHRGPDKRSTHFSSDEYMTAKIFAITVIKKFWQLRNKADTINRPVPADVDDRVATDAFAGFALIRHAHFLVQEGMFTTGVTRS